MAVQRTYERFAHNPVYARAAIDKFAAARLPKTVIPPVLGEVRFFVTGRVTAPAATYDPPLEFISWTNRSGFFLFSGETRRPDRPGTLQLTPGRYKLRVESDYYELKEEEIKWPPEVYDKSKDLELVPGPDYPFPNLDVPQRQLSVTLLRGTLLTAGGKAIKGAKVKLIAPNLPVPLPAPEPPYFIAFIEGVTNERGEWVLSMIEVNTTHGPVDFEHSQIRVTLENGADEVADVVIEPGTENSLRQTALRGRVRKPGGSAFPKVKITTSVAAGQSITGEDGQWFFYFDLRQGDGPVTVTATAPDGRTSSRDVEITHKATVTVEEMEIS